MARIELGLKVMSQVTVVASGTPVPLSAVPLLVSSAIVQWSGGNVGDVYIGEFDVTGTKCIVLNSSTPSMKLDAEDTVSDEDNVVFDLNKIYVDAANNGEKVNLAYVEVIDKAYNS